MDGLGTIVNFLAIIVAGGVGVTFCGKLKIRYQEILLQVVGIAALLLGIRGMWTSIFVMDGKRIEIDGTLLIIFALVIGTIFGEAFRLDRGLDKLGHLFRRFAEKENESDPKKAKSGKGGASRRESIRRAQEAEQNARGKRGKSKKAPVPETPKKVGRFSLARLAELPTYDLPDPRSGSLFVDGFVIATLICAFNGMGFAGAYADGMTGDAKTIFIKTAIDAVLVFALAMVYGAGPAFASISVLIVEGIVTLTAIFAGQFLTDALLGQLGFIGSLMTLGVGIMLCFGKRWRVVNLMPALLIPPIYELVIILVERFIEK